jgi:anti-sigma factor (TIGR02949 family)
MSLFDRVRKALGLGDAPLGGGEGDLRDESRGQTSQEAPMIECHEAMEKLFEFLDRELAPGEHEEVARHFEVCARCYPALTFERSFREALLRSQEGEATPPELRSKVIQVLQQEGFVPSDP